MSRWATSAELFAPKKNIYIINRREREKKRYSFLSFNSEEEEVQGDKRGVRGRRREGVCDDTLRWEDTASARREGGRE